MVDECRGQIRLGATITLRNVLGLFAATASAALGLAAALSPDAAQLVLVVAALTLAVVLAAPSFFTIVAPASVPGFGGITHRVADRSASDPTYEVVRLVLLSQPRR